MIASHIISKVVDNVKSTLNGIGKIDKVKQLM